MDRQDRGKEKEVTTKKKKKTPPSYRRPMGICICEPQPDSVPSRPFSHSRSSQELHPAPTHVGSLDDGIQTHLLPITIPTPGHCSLGGDYSDVPSTSATRSSHSGSVGLSGLRLRDTPETPTTGYSGAPVIQPGTRDNKRRTYIMPEGLVFRPNDRISKIIFKCISRNFRSCWPYWSKIPALDVASCSLNLRNISIGMTRIQEKYFTILKKEPVVDLMGCAPRNVKRNIVLLGA